MTTTTLGGGAGMQTPTPSHALLPIIHVLRAVDRHVHLDHAGTRLDAQLGGRRARVVVGAVRVLEDEETAAGGEGGVEEDGVGCGYGVVGVLGFSIRVELHGVWLFYF